LKYIKANHIVVDRLIYLFLESVRVPASGTEGVIQTLLGYAQDESMLPIALIGISIFGKQQIPPLNEIGKVASALQPPQQSTPPDYNNFTSTSYSLGYSHFQVVTKDDLIGIVQASIS
jgi:hypothetical protein